MENSYRYFENHACQYYPCHEGIEEMNCLFCYCPLYRLTQCPGNPIFIDQSAEKKQQDGKVHKLKVCSSCTFPHQAENYERVIELLKTMY